MCKKTNDIQEVSDFTFWLYIYFIIDFLLHLSARIPDYGVIRPTLLLTLTLTILLISQKDILLGLGDNPVFKKIKWLILYVVITLPLVTWPGSVLIINIPIFSKAIVFFFFTAWIIDTERRLKIFLFIYIFCQIFRVLEPLYMNITTGYWGSSTHLGYGEFAARLSGAPADVVNPNGLGFVIVTVIPYIYYLAWQSPYKLLKLSFIITFPLLLYALILTMSRGAFIALLVVFLMIFKKSKHKLLFIVLTIAGSLSIWPNLSEDQKDRYMSLVSSDTKQSASADGRLQGMINELTVVLERPIIGHGLGTSKEAKVHSGVGWRLSHNLYIEVLIELGIFGFLIFIFLLKSIYKGFQENSDKIRLCLATNEVSFSFRLNMAMITVFWMYVVFSINYFGLSTYYWYMFSGLTIAFTRIYFSKVKEEDNVRYKLKNRI